MEFRLLGPVEARLGDQVIDLGHARQRAVLAVLALEAGRLVPLDRIIDCVWGESPPAAARRGVYSYITRLRAALAAAGPAGPGARLARRAGGYLLEADREHVDVFCFRRMVTEAGGAGDEQAETLLAAALGLWRGPALAGVDSSWLRVMRDGLERERLAAAADLNDARLRLGRHAGLAAELAGQVAAAPGDERLAGQLMLALYRSGQPAGALRVFEQARGYLAEELGADPGPALRELHAQVLRADPALNLPAAAAGASAVPPAPAPAAVPVPRELPADVAAFTGRDAELAELDRLLLGGSRPVTAAVISAVAGTAGVGKTALALHWAHGAAGSFPDGQLHVNLRGYDPDQPVTPADALARFLVSLGVPGPQIPAEEEDRAARYRSLLAGRRVLVVLDNAASVEQVRPLLPGDSACAVLVTSRDSLAGLVARDGARRLDLDVLPLPDAVALLAGLAGERAPAEPEAVTALALQCARLPLALRIAAELAAARPGVPLAGLVAELGDERRRLDLLSADSDPRAAVRAVFAWSCDQLDQEKARAFRLAGLHPGADFDAYAVAALAGSTLAEASQVLADLARAHLIEPAGPGRYGMHDLLRAYARELAARADGEDESRAALTRLFDYYLAVAAAGMDAFDPAERSRRPRVAAPAGPAPRLADADSARGWLDGERANLTAVAVHAAGHGWPAHATGMSATLFRYLSTCGHAADQAAVHGAARRAARQAGDLAGEAAALSALGIASRVQGRLEEATAQLRQALLLFRQAHDPRGEALALANMGAIAWQQGSYVAAERHYRQGAALDRAAGDVTGQANALNSLGVLASDQGHYQQAADTFRRALDLFRQAGDKIGEAMALDNLGDSERQLGHYEQAAAHHRQALALARELGDVSTEALSLHNLGLVDHQTGRHDQAAAQLRQALGIYRQLNRQPWEAEARVDLGAALLASGQPAEAQGEYAAALALATQIGHPRLQAGAARGLGNCCLARGDAEGARGHFERALAVYAEIGAPEADDVRARLDSLAAAGASGRPPEHHHETGEDGDSHESGECGGAQQQLRDAARAAGYEG